MKKNKKYVYEANEKWFIILTYIGIVVYMISGIILLNKFPKIGAKILAWMLICLAVIHYILILRKRLSKIGYIFIMLTGIIPGVGLLGGIVDGVNLFNVMTYTICSNCGAEIKHYEDKCSKCGKDKN